MRMITIEMTEGQADHLVELLLKDLIVHSYPAVERADSLELATLVNRACGPEQARRATLGAAAERAPFKAMPANDGRAKAILESVVKPKPGKYAETPLQMAKRVLAARKSYTAYRQERLDNGYAKDHGKEAQYKEEIAANHLYVDKAEREVERRVKEANGEAYGG